MIKRKTAMKQIRAKLTTSLNQCYAYSEPRKKCQRIKLYGVPQAAAKAADVMDAVKALGLAGVIVDLHYNEYNVGSIVLKFDKAVYN